MLPPVDPVKLSANPRFGALYQDLCNNKLNPDGTSRADAKAQRDRDGLNKDLRKARTNAFKTQLVKSGLQELSYRPDHLPDELQELVAVVATLLEGQVPEEDRDLLRDDLMKFNENIKPITTALLKLLQQDVDILATLVDPDESPSAESLPAAIQDLKTSISNSRSIVGKSRLTLVQKASTLHDLYRQAIERSIRILGQTIHGSVARGTKAEVDYLAMVAEGMNKKLSLQHGQLMSQLYSPDVQDALREKYGTLERDSKKAKRKVREAEGKLDDYRKAGGMKNMAQEYADILKEAEKTRAEIARLERGMK